jgi:hypothetical protein
VTATNQTEYLAAALLMAASAIFWAYTIGNFCSIVSTSDKYGIKFRQTMDELNVMLSDRRIPHDLRVRVRLYFHEAKVIERQKGYRDLENTLSLVLRGEVASAAQRPWMRKVRAPRDVDPTARTAARAAPRPRRARAAPRHAHPALRAQRTAPGHDVPF